MAITGPVDIENGTAVEIKPKKKKGKKKGKKKKAATEENADP